MAKPRNFGFPPGRPGHMAAEMPTQGPRGPHSSFSSACFLPLSVPSRVPHPLHLCLRHLDEATVACPPVCILATPYQACPGQLDPASVYAGSTVLSSTVMPQFPFHHLSPPGGAMTSQRQGPCGAGAVLRPAHCQVYTRHSRLTIWPQQCDVHWALATEGRTETRPRAPLC